MVSTTGILARFQVGILLVAILVAITGIAEWDGYSDTCADSDGDGICDNPLVINENNIDYLPLKSRTGDSTITVTTTTILMYTTTVTTTTRTITETVGSTVTTTKTITYTTGVFNYSYYCHHEDHGNLVFSFYENSVFAYNDYIDHSGNHNQSGHRDYYSKASLL